MIATGTNINIAQSPQLARGHHNRVNMPVACCPTVMAGHVPAILSESLSRLVAGTCPAMTVGWMSVHRDLAVKVMRRTADRDVSPVRCSWREDAGMADQFVEP